MNVWFRAGRSLRSSRSTYPSLLEWRNNCSLQINCFWYEGGDALREISWQRPYIAVVLRVDREREMNSCVLYSFLNDEIMQLLHVVVCIVSDVKVVSDCTRRMHHGSSLSSELSCVNKDSLFFELHRRGPILLPIIFIVVDTLWWCGPIQLVYVRCGE